MTSILVSPDALREKARLIRTLLDERRSEHQSLWSEMLSLANSLPADLQTSYTEANIPWKSAIETLYENYYQLARDMEAAADAYEQGDKNVQISFTPIS